MSSTKSGRSRLVLAAIVVLAASAVEAQENLDAGKSAPKLFAESCASCHRSPKGLAKGRFTSTLYVHLQQHYAANSSSAWALASYLNSVDATAGRRQRTAASPRPAPNARTSLRPPLPVPGR